MSTYGHATPEEQQQIQALEVRVDAATSPLDEVLELALLYIEPCHRAESVASLLQAILQREPNHSLAKIWMAYCCRWTLIAPEWQRYAQGLLEEVVVSEPDPELVAGAYLMLAQLSRELAFPKWNEPEPLTRYIELLYASIQRAPDWCDNHMTLAWIFKESGRLSEAIEHLQQAIDNITGRDPSWDTPTQYFEAYITGRSSDAEYLRRKLDEMKAAAQL